jgi:Putative metal-binding motif/Secretion system C-terminal sorting domain/Ig-like domain CHU_C associated
VKNYLLISKERVLVHVCFSFGILLISVLSAVPSIAQTTIYSEGLNGAGTIQATVSGGTFFSTNTNTNDVPVNVPQWTQGTAAYGVTNGTAIVTTPTLNAAAFCTNSFTMRVGAFSIATSNNGLDAGDFVKVEVSPDNGTTYFTQLTITGSNAGQAYWGFSGTGTASATYAASNSTLTFTPAGSGLRTTDGYSYVSISGLPSSSTLKIRVTCTNSSGNERWIVDDLKVIGQTPIQALSVTNGSNCGVGTVNLTATDMNCSNFNQINWYAASTGGTALQSNTASPSTYTTPSLSTTTTYYAEEVFTVGVVNHGTTAVTQNTAGLVFNVTSAFTFKSFDVMVRKTTTGSAGFSWAIQNSSGTTLTSGSITITGGTTDITTTVPVNYDMSVGTGYKIIVTGFNNLSRLYKTTLAGFPMPFGLGSITSGTGATATTDYSYFYNWKIAQPRLAVVATINPGSVTPSVSIAASATSICTGSSVTFTATPTNGGSAPTYQWKVNGTNAGSGGTTFTTSSLANGDVVTCVMTSNNACQTASSATSNSVTITVSANVTPSISIAASATSICSGVSVTFTATPTNGGSSPAYQWKKNGSNVGTNSSTFTTASLVNGDVITCVLTANNACQSSSTATSNTLTMTVTASVTPSVSIAASATSICAGVSVTFTATPTNGGSSPTYQWLLNGSNTGVGGTSYSSSALANGDIVTCVMTANNTCQTSSTATSNAVTMTVTANVTPTLSIGASATTICAGTSVTFTASVTNGGPSPSYQWKKNGGNVGTNSSTFATAILSNNDVITCVVTSNNTCQSTNTATSNSITMTVNPMLTPSVAISATSTNICSGTSVTFTATPTNGGPSPSYQWKKNGSNVGTNSTTFTTSGLLNNDVITCVMTANNTCQSANTATSNSITMSVTANVTPSISIISSATSLCSGTNVTFTANATNGGSLPIYQWYLNSSAVGTNSSSYSNSSLANGDVVEAVLTANNVCQTTSSATSNIVTLSVTANVTPSVSIATTANSICSGTSVTFTATPTNGGSAPSYQWKLNGSNVGSNATTYTSTTLANGDVVTCVMTANNPCQTVSSVTSNSETMTVTSLVTFYLDDDTDGYGDNSITTTGCTAPSGYVALSGDCNDTDPNINPGEAEICDGVDQDCDGVADDGLSFTTYYVDADGDNYGSTSAGSFCANPGAGYSLNNTDCDDANPNVYPNNVEICNDADDNCNSLIDDGIAFTTYYFDLDMDGYGAGTGTAYCSNPGASYSVNNYDCNDTYASIYPGATETCNGMDDNCDSFIDEGLLQTYYADADSDGFGNPSVSTTACTAPAGFVLNNTDCNDVNALLTPNTIWYQDADGDGYYGNTQVACLSPGVSYSLSHGLDDCDDAHANVNLGATEICDGLDNNCNGTIDEGVQSTYYLDADGDGYGVSTSVQGCTMPAGYATVAGDCNDANEEAYPGESESCDGVDNNCNGNIDEGCPSTTPGEEPYNALYQPAYYYSYCANFYGNLDGAFPSTNAHSTCITGEDKWYTFTAISEGVTIYIGSYLNDIVIELQDANGNLLDVENAVSGIGTEIMNYYGLVSGHNYRVGIRNYNSGLSASGAFSGCIRLLKRGGSDSGGAQWPSNISTCNIFKATYAGGTTGVQYRYTFTGLSGVAAGNVYTKTQTSDYLTISSISPILPSGCSYSVLVTNIYTLANGAGVNEVINAPALSPTTVTIAADPATQLRVADQQSSGPRFRGAVIGSLPWICGISNWRWKFTEVNAVTHTPVGIPIEVNRGAASNFINIGTISQLQYGKTYAVQTAPVFIYTGTNYNWGPIAYMSIIGNAGMVLDESENAQASEAQARMAQEQQLELVVYPNPSNGTDLMMSISGANMDNATVKVMDAMGRVVYQDRVNVQGVLQTNLNLPTDLASGIYILSLTHQNSTKSSRFVIERI